MDWLFTTENGICHVRVAGILLRENRLLVQRDSEGAYALPGGHLGFDETTDEALRREFKEELGLDILCKRLLWTEENFWRWGGKDAHNLGYYYLVQLSEGSSAPKAGTAMKDNSKICFDWLPIDSLEDAVLYPEFLKTEISHLDGPLKHFIRHR